MATFIRLTRDNSGEAVYVNMDRVTTMERHASYTTLTTENNQRSVVSVSEPPDQIVDLIRHEKKAQT